MMARFMIEFVVDVPNDGVAGDVGSRLYEHQVRLCEVLTSVTGHSPLRTPDQPGILVSAERVHWDAKEKDWIGEDDGNED